ncbi:FAD-dependent oxidoreductase [Devosia naphthalenivorans]|uniref:FAD-dependent oxidoreductase n=1 Tax=Devosia naphthalenivorans TaxID=2082392 RepID=UPI000D37E871|nr:FAD-dependent oxidoreductase [Devosia naphthalenivorans]
MESTTCVIAGGGPAGIMLGLLLSRAGIAVTVLEKHADFLRDFRGDTVHASTIELLDELGLGNAFRKLPQTRLQNFQLPLPDGSTFLLGDFSTLKPPYNYVALIPQWDFLDFLVGVARREPSFAIRMNTEVTGLRLDGERVSGVHYREQDGMEGDIVADLVVACDGRHSILRDQAGLVPHEFNVPFDTWWFRLPRYPAEMGEVAAVVPQFGDRDVMLTLTREDFYQIAYFAEKGADARLRAEGIERFRQRIASMRPDFADRLDTLTSMDDLHLLDVRLNRLKTWHRIGLLCIGDAAHAMSPAGGVGINLAIQDAVAAATRLAVPLREVRLTDADLATVRRRRWMPTVVIQRLQRILHRVLFVPAFEGRRRGPPSLIVLLARYVPGFTALPARLVAFGPRPEHAPDFAQRAQTEPPPEKKTGAAAPV